MKRYIHKIKHHTKNFYHLLKPEDVVDAIISISAIAIISHGSISLTQIDRFILALFYGFFLFSASIILHQYYDLGTDKINKPERPLASGKISPRVGLYLSIIAYSLSILISFLLGFIYLIIAIFGIILSLIYSHPSHHTRRKSIILPLIVLNMGYTFITFIIGWCVYQPISTIPLWLITFLFITDMVAVFSKDYRDYDGDKKHGYISLPIVYGYHTAAKINVIMYVMPFVILLSLSIVGLIPIKFGLVGLYYILSGYYAFSLLFHSTNKNYAVLCYKIITVNLILIRVLLIWVMVL